MAIENYLPITPSQTVGPYFAYGLVAVDYDYCNTQIANGTLVNSNGIKGERITIVGRVFDGKKEFIPDALVEIWQPDADGNFSNSSFLGFGRMGTGSNADGRFCFETIKPGSSESIAPYITVIVFMRGLLTHAFTRIYFGDEIEANANDKVLQSIDPVRRKTLIAEKEPSNTIDNEYHFDIHMQGENETVFFSI